MEAATHQQGQIPTVINVSVTKYDRIDIRRAKRRFLTISKTQFFQTLE
jgi:hypothetical protein